MTDNGSQETAPVFVRGNEQLNRLLSNPQIAADVAEATAAAEEMDRGQVAGHGGHATVGPV